MLKYPAPLTKTEKQAMKILNLTQHQATPEQIAFSVRESVEETQPDGSVIKRNVFKHAGFVVA